MPPALVHDRDMGKLLHKLVPSTWPLRDLRPGPPRPTDHQCRRITASANSSIGPSGSQSYRLRPINSVATAARPVRGVRTRCAQCARWSSY